MKIAREDAGPSLDREMAALAAHSASVPAPRPFEITTIDGRRALIMGRVRGTPEEDKLCHLDFHPANVLVNGSELVVIDWPGACRGDPLADVACSARALSDGVEPPGTPWLTHTFAPAVRKLLLNGYLRGYRSRRTIEPSLYARWRIVAARTWRTNTRWNLQKNCSPDFLRLSGLFLFGLRHAIVVTHATFE